MPIDPLGPVVKILKGRWLYRLVPHRGPARLIQVVGYDPEKPDELTALWKPQKRLFEGHFNSELTVLPGHYAEEAAAVACTALATIKSLAGEGVVAIPLLREKEVKFSRAIMPGDWVTIRVRLVEVKPLRQNMGTKATFEFEAFATDIAGKEVLAMKGAITGVMAPH